MAKMTTKTTVTMELDDREFHLVLRGLRRQLRGGEADEAKAMADALEGLKAAAVKGEAKTPPPAPAPKDEPDPAANEHAEGTLLGGP